LNGITSGVPGEYDLTKSSEYFIVV